MIIDGYALAGGMSMPEGNLVAALDRLGINRVALCPGMVANPLYPLLEQTVRALPKADLVLAANLFTRVAARFGRHAAGPFAGNQTVFDLARKYPGRILQFYRVNPTRPNSFPEMAKAYSQFLFKGIQLHQPADGFRCSGKPLHQIADFASVNHLPILIHLASRESVREFAAFSQMNPEVQFIAAHLTGMEWFAETPRDFPNLNFEISPCRLVSDLRVMRAVKSFGAEHVIFGSAIVCGADDQKENIERVLRLPLLDSEKRMILGENMSSLLGISR